MCMCRKLYLTFPSLSVMWASAPVVERAIYISFRFTYQNSTKPTKTQSNLLNPTYFQNVLKIKKFWIILGGGSILIQKSSEILPIFKFDGFPNPTYQTQPNI